MRKFVRNAAVWTMFAMAYQYWLLKRAMARAKANEACTWHYGGADT